MARRGRGDLRKLLQVASLQGGYFTAHQAHEAGYSRWSLYHHSKTGRFERVARGFYRLPEYPASPFEDVIAAWLKLGPERAVVSHETALALHDLSSVRPQKIHLTLPRELRPPGNRPRLPAVKVHTTTKLLGPAEVVQRYGVRLTSPVRTIVDVAEAGTDPAHVIEATIEAFGRGLVTGRELLAAARGRSARVQQLIERALEEAGHGAPVR